MPDAKRKAREAARRAAQQAAAEAWQTKVEAHFSYLRTNYGFRITKVDASSFWETRLIYQSDVAAVAVDRSVEFGRVEVSVIRLVDGAIPPYPIFILPDTIINQTLFDNIMLIRDPGSLEEVDNLRGLGNEQIEKSLTYFARALEVTLPDFLHGDLSIFAAADELIKQRVKAHPPTISVHLPQDATADEEAEAVAKVREGSPGVRVVAQRYRRPASRKRKTTPDGAH